MTFDLLWYRKLETKSWKCGIWHFSKLSLIIQFAWKRLSVYQFDSQAQQCLEVTISS